MADTQPAAETEPDTDTDTDTSVAIVGLDGLDMRDIEEFGDPAKWNCLPIETVAHTCPSWNAIFAGTELPGVYDFWKLPDEWERGQLSSQSKEMWSYEDLQLRNGDGYVWERDGVECDVVSVPITTPRTFKTVEADTNRPAVGWPGDLDEIEESIETLERETFKRDRVVTVFPIPDKSNHHCDSGHISQDTRDKHVQKALEIAERVTEEYDRWVILSDHGRPGMPEEVVDGLLVASHTPVGVIRSNAFETRGRTNTQLADDMAEMFRSPAGHSVAVAGLEADFRVTSYLERDFLTHDSLIGEQPVIEDMAAEVDDSDVLYDIGANIGLYACLFAGAVMDVVAFEPAPQNYERLVENRGLNDSDFVAMKVAVADTDGMDTFHSPQDAPGEGHARLHAAGDTHVNTVRLDTVIGGPRPAPTILKIDVEGAEARVLDGAADLLESAARPRLIYVEAHPDRCAPETVETTLRGWGYTLTTIDQASEDGYVLKAMAPGEEIHDE